MIATSTQPVARRSASSVSRVTTRPGSQTSTGLAKIVSTRRG